MSGSATRPIPFIDVAQALHEAGFPAGISQETFLAIIDAESGRIPDIDSPVRPDGSIDQGIVQINSKAHPDVTNAQAHYPAFAIKWAFTESKQGTDFGPWMAYRNGSYVKSLQAARVALDGAARLRAAGVFNK